jgi:predicted nucleic acid-binding Zn ribbon protein
MTVKKKARATRKKIKKTITTTVTREVVSWTAWCEWCGKKIEGKRKGTRFCSSTCRVYAHRDEKRREGG